MGEPSENHQTRVAFDAEEVAAASHMIRTENLASLGQRTPKPVKMTENGRKVSQVEDIFPRNEANEKGFMSFFLPK